MTSSVPPDVPALIERYEALAVAWDTEAVAKRANKIFDQLHAIALHLRPDAEGRKRLEALLAHPNRGVRLKAAGDCLAWASPAAVSALEELVTPRGRHSLSAETTLQEFRAGRMSVDW
ncbi:MAG: DUF2019 domain-containing protein [Frankiaceae bacterium]|nr:DUF2019 domain-containing protein [Frankiaceae bacterium]MBV9869073.1 DUF2019 domain-containing protein [Frankiaceae bacterium]